MSSTTFRNVQCESVQFDLFLISQKHQNQQKYILLHEKFKPFLMPLTSFFLIILHLHIKLHYTLLHSGILIIIIIMNL